MSSQFCKICGALPSKEQTGFYFFKEKNLDSYSRELECSWYTHVCIAWSSWHPRSPSLNRSKVEKLFCCFVSPHLVCKFSTELDVNAKPAQNIRWKHLQAHYFFSPQRSDRGQNGQSEVSKQDKQQQGKGEREKVCERNVYFHSSPPPHQGLSCLLVLSPPGSASTSQSINLVWSKACLQ